MIQIIIRICKFYECSNVKIVSILGEVFSCFGRFYCDVGDRKLTKSTWLQYNSCCVLKVSPENQSGSVAVGGVGRVIILKTSD